MKLVNIGCFVIIFYNVEPLSLSLWLISGFDV